MNSQKSLHRLNKVFQKANSYNPFIIAEAYDIEYQYVNASNSFEGQTSSVLDQPLILLNDCLADSPRRFAVMAHELCHVLEHDILVSYYTLGTAQKSKLEYEANRFTASLLLQFYSEYTGYEATCLKDVQNVFLLEEEYEMYYF